MKIAVVVVYFHTPQTQKNTLLRSLKKTGLDYELFTHNNDKNNLGLAKAVNICLKNALAKKHEYFLVLNPDIEIEALKETDLFMALSIFQIIGGAIKQSKTVYYGGYTDPVFLSGGLSDKKPVAPNLATDFVSGSLMFFSRQTLEKVGFFNEDYFMYYEDVEFCHRALLLGLKVGICTNIIYKHFETSRKNTKKEYFLTRNRLLFVREYGNRLQKLFNKLQYFRLLLKTLFAKTDKTKYILQGYKDFAKL